MPKWITRLTMDQEILGSSPGWSDECCSGNLQVVVPVCDFKSAIVPVNTEHRRENNFPLALRKLMVSVHGLVKDSIHPARLLRETVEQRMTKEFWVRVLAALRNSSEFLRLFL
ncbi:hypothetical protein TNCV_543031 [Trichonephila clavipes]|nr:hypothetical protein TNCV_543031 [Trichonephila clavipes]